MKTALVALALALASAVVTVPAAAETESRDAILAVESARMLYVDGYDNAEFTAEGCVAATDVVVRKSTGCSPSSGTLRGALLGFDAAHHVDAGAADAPVLQASSSQVQQLSQVIVDLKEPGTLHVDLTFTGVPDMTARPVASSSSPSAASSDEDSVSWTVVDATPGRLVFSVPFAASLGATELRHYRPAATVTLSGTRATLFDTAEGPVASPDPVTREARLLLAQHVAPREGLPAFSDGGWLDAPNIYGLPGAWANTVDMTGFGHHHTPRHGQRTGIFNTPYEHLAPGGGHALTHTDSLATVIPLDKVEMVFGSEFNGAVDWGLRTAPTGPDQFNRVSPTAGIIWDSDSVRAARVMTGASLWSKRTGTPANNDGRMTFLDAGTEARAWASTVAGSAPGGEGNAFNPRQPLSQQLDAALITARSIPLVVSEGDIDNTTGETAVSGPTMDIRPPEGKTFARVGTTVVFPPNAELELETVTDRGATGLTLEGVAITPRIGVGGYWLQSLRDGYAWDWGGHVSVTTAVTDAFFPELDYIQTLTVPQGMAALVAVTQRDGATQQLRLNHAGTYRIEAGSAGLTAHQM